jgi:hypothetical protein
LRDKYGAEKEMWGYEEGTGASWFAFLRKYHSGDLNEKEEVDSSCSTFGVEVEEKHIRVLMGKP